jgi:undecaprenyl-diphosphatase
LGIFESVILGIVEGLSEFLPISSTGHLILVSALLKIKQTDAHKVFEVTIQSGAMLAVVYIYRSQLTSRVDLLKWL